LSKSWPCPACTGGRLLEEQTVLSMGTVIVWKCNQCGLRKQFEAPSQKPPSRPRTPEPFPDSPKASPKPGRKKTGPVPRRISVPTLSPPSVPRNNEDRNGAYQIQCRTYDGYQHFRERAAFYREQAQSHRSKSEKLSSDYRARLCENLAHTLGRIYLRQTPKLLRRQLRAQHRLDHAVKISDQPLTRLFKTYLALMLQAMTHLKNDPIVQDWKSIRSKLGDRKYLRKARRGLEKGVRAPYTSGTEALADLTTVELGMEGRTDGKIRAALKAQGLPTRSREGIRKRLKRLREKPPLIHSI